MNIGEVAERSGIPPKTIRYYEDIGLLTPPRRENGYRTYREQELHKLPGVAETVDWAHALLRPGCTPTGRFDGDRGADG